MAFVCEPFRLAPGGSFCSVLLYRIIPQLCTYVKSQYCISVKLYSLEATRNPRLGGRGWELSVMQRGEGRSGGGEMRRPRRVAWGEVLPVFLEPFHLLIKIALVVAILNCPVASEFTFSEGFGDFVGDFPGSVQDFVFVER